MAKKTFTNFRASVDSFPLGEKHIGIFKPGRYNGFDKMITRGALDITINHSGKVRKTKTNNTYANAHGVLLFGTGTIFHSDEDVQLQVQSNTGNPNIRIDYVIAENSYQEIAGGTPVIFSIITGPADGTLPVLSNPAKQVHIGVITLNANGYLYTDLVYKPVLAPILGDVTYNEFVTMINEYVDIPDADGNTKGIVQTATQAEVEAGSEAIKYVTPKGLHNKKATKTKEGIIRVATRSEIITGDAENLAVSAKDIRGKDNKESLDLSYTITANDLGKIFLGNGLATITITVPTGLPENFWFGCIAVGSNIKIIGSGTTIKVQSGKVAETKSLNSSILVESVSANDYVVLGNLKSV